MVSCVCASELALFELLHETKHIAETNEAKTILLNAIDFLVLIQVQIYGVFKGQNSRNATL
jgi:hypothetical protein